MVDICYRPKIQISNILENVECSMSETKNITHKTKCLPKTINNVHKSKCINNKTNNESIVIHKRHNKTNKHEHNNQHVGKQPKHKRHNIRYKKQQRIIFDNNINNCNLCDT